MKFLAGAQDCEGKGEGCCCRDTKRYGLDSNLAHIKPRGQLHDEMSRNRFFQTAPQ